MKQYIQTCVFIWIFVPGASTAGAANGGNVAAHGAGVLGTDWYSTAVCRVWSCDLSRRPFTWANSGEIKHRNFLVSFEYWTSWVGVDIQRQFTMFKVAFLGELVLIFNGSLQSLKLHSGWVSVDIQRQFTMFKVAFWGELVLIFSGSLQSFKLHSCGLKKFSIESTRLWFTNYNLI